MKTLLAVLALVLIPQDMPQDAQKIITQADQKLEALRKSYEDSCAKVKAQELKDLQRIHDAIEKGNPAGATAIKTKIDVLAADVVAVVKGGSSVEQWLQGKWTATQGGTGDVLEFKGDKVIGSGIGDRTKGRVIVNGSTIQIVWDSGYVETMRVPQNFGDEAPGQGRSGALIFKRLK